MFPTEVLVWLVRKECFLEVCEWTLSVPMGTVVVLLILNLERYRLSLQAKRIARVKQGGGQRTKKSKSLWSRFLPISSQDPSLVKI